MPQLRARLGFLGALAITTSGVVCLGAAGATAATSPATAPRSAFNASYDGGARVPGLVGEYLATGPNAVTNGTVIGPDYTQGTLASEAVGREAVQLTAPGQYVQFTLSGNANAVDVDYALPQGSSGSLALYVDGRKVTDLQLTSAYSYIDTPQIYGSKTRHFYDDVRVLIGRELHRGDTVRLQADANDTALPYTVNLADFYQVAAPAQQPPNSISVLSEGADPTGATDSSAAFAATIAAADARHETVWIPAGDFAIDTPLQVDRASIEGAGNWYSRVRSNEFIDNASAVPGPVNLRDFAILGDTVGRHDDSTANAINGSLGTGSVVNSLWIQNANVGLWLQYGNTGDVVKNSVILDTDADGLNLNGNATGVVVRDDFIRNTGDDGLAIWSYPAVDSHDVFAWDTVEQPNLANGIAEYGGTDNTITHDVITDSNALGSGLTISNEQFASPGFTTLAGTIDVSHDTVIRSGAMNPNWGHPMSAIQIDAYDYAISGVALNLDALNVYDTPYSVFELVSGDGTGLPITGLRITNVNIAGVGTVVFQGETQGSAYVAGVHATGVGVAGTVQDQYPPATPQFQFQLGSGNTGWSLTPTLDYFPAPAS
ncbi:hypothetical protein KDK95_07825 [Actinospica sp. MGRD01-02]|uniref:Mycodextranase n=1 Tax=Actinospica acidithermotolerans TaxID=2828514 RepID=A0A941E4P2_9ACTN|nr:glycosyl hydrolase family 28-related protein [Actinospica acidithermotolerans]MBR7826205.1 hypothetical protein [Actinospica acidithermotolerans]